MGNIADFFEKDLESEVDLALCKIAELEATIKNKDHIIDALKKKIKRLKQRDSGRLTGARRL